MCVLGVRFTVCRNRIRFGCAFSAFPALPIDVENADSNRSKNAHSTPYKNTPSSVLLWLYDPLVQGYVHLDLLQRGLLGQQLRPLHRQPPPCGGRPHQVVRRALVPSVVEVVLRASDRHGRAASPIKGNLAHPAQLVAVLEPGEVGGGVADGADLQADGLALAHLESGQLLDKLWRIVSHFWTDR
jgi:hypothetical protein